MNDVGTDNQSADLLQMVNEMATDFARALTLHRQETNNAQNEEMNILLSRQNEREKKFEEKEKERRDRTDGTT